ncbi:hypothetical protein BU24DRAFT_151676 [Aaosphaeria arxii CBS 175.79]|uniref:Rhodopsin domain-containing protein n=1 Tax=Aaosphaeria arxii CBS 175.79 TaxID=1450172 RepID=A0A6A5XXD0_9PLEO|nr:uncharacterized protein BU24DRAFT_151676 [Aaosphaeria arxii CBS 175.79]KAF2017477.1 hypothetical protein BU24DRAFT_151676 [Aaosphaeria arxii CBS 175.79]
MSAAGTTVLPPYSNKASLYIAPVWTLTAIALPLVILRIASRLKRTKSLYIDDWLILVAEILSLVNVSLGTAAVAYGWGKPIAYVIQNWPLLQKLQFSLQTVWIITLCLVRVSIAFSLLRFGTERSWKYPLYFLIGFQCVISSSYIVIQFAQCKPLGWAWEQIPAKCWDPQPIITYGWVIGGIYVAMDFVLSFMPIRLIRTLNRPTAEKFLISFLMSLGLFATVVCALKMTTFNDFGKGDPNQETIKPSMLTKLEELVGIIAVCLPSLKSPAQNVLKKAGFLKSHELTRPSFVNTIPLSERHNMGGREEDQNSDGADSLPPKDDIRVDSVNVKPGSADSATRNQRKDAWQLV